MLEKIIYYSIKNKLVLGLFAADVGFIALFGVAVLNGIVRISDLYLYFERVKFKPSLTVFIILGSFSSALSQETKELKIFKAQQDFLTNKPTSLATVSEFKVSSIEKIKYIENGQVKSIKFGDVSGFSIDGITYRAYGKRKLFTSYGYYKIEDDSCLVIYSRRNRHRKAGGPIQERLYSRDLSSPIYHIWLEPLKKDFSDNPLFIAKVKPFFRHNYSALYSKNPKTGRIMLNELYCQSFQ